MRGAHASQEVLLVTASIDEMVPADHPIRQIKAVTDEVLLELKPALDAMYSDWGRPGIAPERLLKASVLMALFSVRSERMFCEQLRYNLLFKWFLNLNVNELGFDHSTFSKNRERLARHDIAKAFFSAVANKARLQRYASDEHFTVDGTLLQAWASLKSFRPLDDEGDQGGGGGRNRDVDFKGQKRSNQTHRSTTDAEARLAKKGRGQPAMLSYGLHVLMENRNGLATDLELSQASGRAEIEAATRLLRRQRHRRRRSVAADKGYDNREFVGVCRSLGITPHVAQRTRSLGGSAIDRRTTRHGGYETSQRIRKRVEEIFGWIKTVAGGRKLRLVGQWRNREWAYMATAAYNLVRMAKLSQVGS